MRKNFEDEIEGGITLNDLPYIDTNQKENKLGGAGDVGVLDGNSDTEKNNTKENASEEYLSRHDPKRKVVTKDYNKNKPRF